MSRIDFNFLNNFDETEFLKTSSDWANDIEELRLIVRLTIDKLNTVLDAFVEGVFVLGYKFNFEDKIVHVKLERNHLAAGST